MRTQNEERRTQKSKLIFSNYVNLRSSFFVHRSCSDKQREVEGYLNV